MGANAQTSVPTFTAGEVLTAANMNISARTGVPVFADTTARDAGFGGTGEKTLAEGQLCYLESTNVVQYYDGAAWATVGPTTVSSGLTVVKAETAFTTATTITADNVFTSSYTSYLMYLDINWVAGGTLSLQFRASGSTTATGYNVAKLEAAASVSSSVATSQTSGFVGEGSINFRSSGWIKIIGPQLAQPTMFYSEWIRNQGAYTSPNIQMTYGNQSASTQFDGIILTGSTNGLTGTYAIYGLAKS
jgi:hypothetical protein